MIKEYDESQENLKKQFDNKEEKSINLSGFLIAESYMNELDKYIENLRKNKNSNQNFISSPKIINSFESAMNYLEQNSKLYIISKNLISLIHPNYYLSNCKEVTILGGNGQLIIYFDDNNAFLLFKNKSLNKNKVELNKNYIYIIHEDSKQKLHSYTSICKQKIDCNKISKNYDYIFSFNNFNNQKKGKYHNEGKKNESKYPNFSGIKHSVNIRYSSPKNQTTIPKSNKNKKQHLYNSVQINKSNNKDSKSNYHYGSSKNNNQNSLAKTLSFNLGGNNENEIEIAKLSKTIKEYENLKMQKEKEIQQLRNEILKLEDKIREKNAKLKELKSHDKGLARSYLPEYQIKSKHSKKLSYAPGNYLSSKEIKANILSQSVKPFSIGKDKIKNETTNQQKSNIFTDHNKYEMMKKKYDENYTQLQMSLADKRKKMKSKLKNIPLNKVSVKSFHNPTLVKLDYVKIKLPNYINSIIYCLSQIEDLTNYFLTGDCYQTIINNENSELSLEYDYLINELWPTKNNENIFCPNTFMAEMNKLSQEYGLPFESNDPNDIHYFIVFILEQLHRELKTSKNRNDKQKEVQYDQYDKKNIIKCIDDFKEESSIISKLFFGFKETTEECLNCTNENLKDNILCYNYEMFNCLVFPLDEIKNEINSNNVTIFDCFQFIQKTQLFTDDKRNYCNKCKQVYDSNFTTKIYEFPEVLILVFVRNKESGNSVKLDFEEKLNTFVLKKEAEVKTVIVLDNHIYDLCGVISYKEGIFIDYIASCKSPVDKKWYRYTSSEVTPIDDVQNGIINYETPYVLFYKKGKGK